MARLRVITSDSQEFIGRELPLEGHEITIGRLPESTIIVPDAAVSRRHAKILHTPEGFMLVDDGGRNGLFLNSERTTHAVLTNGDVIRVGHTEMVFEGGSAPSPVARSKPEKPVRERLDQTTMLEAASLAPPSARRRAPSPELRESREGAAISEMPIATSLPAGPTTAPVSSRSSEARAGRTALTASRAALALAILLAGILMVTGVLVARERGLLRNGHRVTRPATVPELVAGAGRLGRWQ